MFTVALPNPSGGRPQAGAIRGIVQLTFSVPRGAGDVIERTLRAHNMSAVPRGRPTLWRESAGGHRELAPARAVGEEQRFEVVPAPDGDAEALALRREVDMLAERKRDLREDNTALERRRDALLTEISSLGERHRQDLERLAQARAIVIKADNEALEEHFAHRSRLLKDAEKGAEEGIKSAWDLRVATAQARRVISEEIGHQADMTKKVQDALHGSLFADGFATFMKEARAGFVEAANSQLGRAVSFKMISGMRKQIESDTGRRVTDGEILEAMLFESKGAAMRQEALQRWANFHAADPLVGAMLFALRWWRGEAGDDVEALDDFLRAHHEKEKRS